MESARRPVVAITNWVHGEVTEYLAQYADVVGNPDREPWSADELARRAADADAILAFMTDRIDGATLARCPRLRVVAGALKGGDNFDVEACTRRGVYVTVVPDLLTAPTAELALGLTIALGRNILHGDRLVRSGAFRGWRPVLYGRGLDGSAVGIFGMGAIGQALARRLRPFGCTLAYHDKKRLEDAEERSLAAEFLAIDALLARSDVVILTVPLTPRTQHLIDAAALARMRPGALLVNPGRGSVVDEEAVADALESGHLGGYAADVFATEDWARADRPPSISPRLLAHPATVFTPHLGSAVDRARREIAMSAARDIVASLGGERPPGAVNDPVPRGAVERHAAVMADR